MRKIICICLTLILLQGCSEIINQKRVDNIKKKYSMLIAGTPRSDIIKSFGNPIEKEGDYIDYYTLCLPDESHAGRYLLMDVYSFGGIEIIATPIELYRAMRDWRDCSIKEDFVLIYDKNEKLKQIFKRYYYNRLVSIYKALLNEVDECSKDKKLSLIYFDHENGWLYVSKDEIICNFQDKFIKICIIEIPSLIFVSKYKPILGVLKVPVSINKTITIDNGNNQFKISSIILHNKNGEVVNSLFDQDWTELNSDSYMKMIADSMAYYCLNGNLREYEQKEKPQMLDLLLNF